MTRMLGLVGLLAAFALGSVVVASAAPRTREGVEAAELAVMVKTLEHRIATLEAAVARGNSAPSVAPKVTAPFEVVDGQGKTIFLVRAEPRGFAVLSEHGEPLAVGSALISGGFFKVLNPGGSKVGVLGIKDAAVLLALRDEDRPRVTLALGADDRPTLELGNNRGTPILAITQGESGGGMLQLDDRDGDPRVEAGTLPSGLGIVRVGPRFACVGGGLAAPDCIKGHQ